ncbi:MAG: bacteriocin [Clostridia bacterium]|nr:bacteriocin [Clostridia bacterium]
MDANVTNILEVALEQGIWAVLYIYLFFRMLKENAQREERYQSMIDDLSKNIQSGIDNIQDRLDNLIQNQTYEE